MAAVSLTKGVQVRFTLATTLTRLIPGQDIVSVWVSCDADTYWTFDDSKADGAAIDATKVYRIPANSQTAMRLTGARPLIAAVSGTPSVTLLPEGE